MPAGSASKLSSNFTPGLASITNLNKKCITCYRDIPEEI